jgi:hypothetical protein
MVFFLSLQERPLVSLLLLVDCVSESARLGLGGSPVSCRDITNHDNLTKEEKNGEKGKT